MEVAASYLDLVRNIVAAVASYLDLVGNIVVAAALVDNIVVAALDIRAVAFAWQAESRPDLAFLVDTLVDLRSPAVEVADTLLRFKIL